MSRVLWASVSLCPDRLKTSSCRYKAIAKRGLRKHERATVGRERYSKPFASVKWAKKGPQSHCQSHQLEPRGLQPVDRQNQSKSMTRETWKITIQNVITTLISLHCLLSAIRLRRFPSQEQQEQQGQCVHLLASACICLHLLPRLPVHVCPCVPTCQRANDYDPLPILWFHQAHVQHRSTQHMMSLWCPWWNHWPGTVPSCNGWRVQSFNPFLIRNRLIHYFKQILISC